jgi:hypothetical protein
MFELIWIALTFTLAIADIICYERSGDEKRRIGTWPGSGFIALYRSRKRGRS